MIERIANGENDGPIFYHVKRIGKNGRVFNMYKLNVKNPIAEFPQFINVLFGSMTLVGPRPYNINQKERMGEYYDIITSVKPGITGIFQIAGRDVSEEERLDLDLYYILNHDAKMNLKIVLITAFVTLRNKEARYYRKYLYNEIPKDVVGNFVVRKARAFVKRAMDIIVSLIGCIIVLPLSLIVKIAYMLTGDFSSIFYSQERIGKNGKTFKMYKFRSMVSNADEVLKEIMENENVKKEWEEYHKIENDPRITKVGKFLRVTSLDEIPQLFNVLKGDMAIVGNRPYMLKEKQDMGEYYDDIIKTKPGVTGIWQVSGRSSTTFEERLALESEYSNNCTILGDIGILLKTVSAVVKRKGSK